MKLLHTVLVQNEHPLAQITKQRSCKDIDNAFGTASKLYCM